MKCINPSCNSQLKGRFQKKYCSLSCAAEVNNKTKGPRPIETRAKISQALMATSQVRRSKNEAVYYQDPKICIICKAVIGYARRTSPTCSSECARTNQKLRCREAALSRGFGGYNHRKVEYNGQLFDSSWEVKIAKELDANCIKWVRPKKFKLSTNQHYTPDFYLPAYGLYLDPKAYVKPSRKEDTFGRIARFEHEYSTRCLVIQKEQHLTWDYIKSQL
jgi:hypothetical protein